MHFALKSRCHGVSATAPPPVFGTLTRNQRNWPVNIDSACVTARPEDHRPMVASSDGWSAMATARGRGRAGPRGARLSFTHVVDAGFEGLLQTVRAAEGDAKVDTVSTLTLPPVTNARAGSRWSRISSSSLRGPLPDGFSAAAMGSRAVRFCRRSSGGFGVGKFPLHLGNSPLLNATDPRIDAGITSLRTASKPHRRALYAVDD